MTTHRIPGGGGTQLNVEDTGNVDGPSVVFIHGFSQSAMSWTTQMRSDLTDRLRLVSLDLRGHGLSERPTDGYGDSRMWADDINAVITELDLQRPILCGWSYGGIVIGDYLQYHGTNALGGIALVAAISRLGESILPHLGSEFLACTPGFFTTDVTQSMDTLETFVGLCRADEPGPDEIYQALGYNAIVPPRVRQALLDRTVDHDNEYAGLDLPVMITHGLQDRIVLPSISEHLAAITPNATTSFYAGVGHATFMEAPKRFNDELLAFATKV